MKSSGSGLGSYHVSFKSGNRRLITGHSLPTEEERNSPIVPIRGCLEKIRRMLGGGEYVGKGSSQRGLGRSPLRKPTKSRYMEGNWQYRISQKRSAQIRSFENTCFVSLGNASYANACPRRSITPTVLLPNTSCFSQRPTTGKIRRAQSHFQQFRAGLRRWAHPGRRRRTWQPAVGRIQQYSTRNLRWSVARVPQDAGLWTIGGTIPAKIITDVSRSLILEPFL